MIRLTALIENTSADPRLTAQHGLSVYIETEKHKLLCDLGQNGLFIENAAKLGVDLRAVDAVMISHGHYDHGGGLADFIRLNPAAQIYIRSSAFDGHYSLVNGKCKNIGLEASLREIGNFVYTDGEQYVIDDELTLFSDVRERDFYSRANDSLLTKQGEAFAPDSFDHEQYLMVSNSGQQLLLTGCSHAGIVNIVRKFEAAYKTALSPLVLGGFHLYDAGSKRTEDPETVRTIADELIRTGNRYYTCHCTGTEAYEIMKERMGDRLGYFSTGSKIVIS